MSVVQCGQRVCSVPTVWPIKKFSTCEIALSQSVLSLPILPILLHNPKPTPCRLYAQSMFAGIPLDLSLPTPFAGYCWYAIAGIGYCWCMPYAVHLVLKLGRMVVVLKLLQSQNLLASLREA